MLLDDVEQALFAAKWGNAEADEYEVIARMLELPREAVIRVEFLLHAVRTSRLMPYTIEQVFDEESEIPEDVRKAMTVLLRQGLLRVRVRECIRDEKYMKARTHKLVRNAADVCNGCRFSVECITQSLSTPENCHERGIPAELDRKHGVSLMRYDRGAAIVFPLKLRNNKVTVRCDHPKGEFVIPIEELWP